MKAAVDNRFTVEQLAHCLIKVRDEEVAAMPEGVVSIRVQLGYSELYGCCFRSCEGDPAEFSASSQKSVFDTDSDTGLTLLAEAMIAEVDRQLLDYTSDDALGLKRTT